MATLDARYVQATVLQHVFREKDEGLPLSDGELWFYRDTARNELKSVYKYAGTPTDPSFAELPNPLPLTNIGTVSDGSGNDILFFYFPEDEEENIDRYFIEVWSSPGKLGGGILQFTREAQPTTVNEIDVAEDNFIDNYFSNGQFLIHNNLSDLGEIEEKSTPVAKGGWSWERPDSSTATDLITFERFNSFIEIPESNPRYSIRCRTTVPDASDAFKDLRNKIKDVNFFSSDVELMTFQMESSSNTGGPINVELILIKNFGAGGSAQTEQSLTTFTLQPGYDKFIHSFIVGSNDGFIIGPNDDDFIQLSIRFPSGLINDVNITNMLLRDGEFDSLVYPDQSYAIQQAQALGGSLPIPDYAGSDIGKYLKVTDRGYEYASEQGGVGVITGCLVENDGGDLNHDIKFQIGKVHDTTSEHILELETPLIKQVDALWEEGNNKGGLFSGVFAATTTYHLFWIYNPATGTTDCGFDTSVVAANRPVGYLFFARVASLKSTAVPALYSFIQTAEFPNDFLLRNVPITFVNQGTNSNSNLVESRAPINLILNLKLQATLTNSSNVQLPELMIVSGLQPSIPVITGVSTLRTSAAVGGALQASVNQIDVLSDTSSRIRWRGSNSAGSSTTTISLLGWTDTRGQK